MKVVVIEDHDQSVRRILESIQKLEDAVDSVNTFANFHEFVRTLPRRGQPDLLFVDMRYLDAKARRFLKSGKLSSMLILTNSLKLNGFQLDTIKEQLSIRQNLLKSEEVIASQDHYDDSDYVESSGLVVNAAHSAENWQERFLVKGNQKMLVVPSENISHFFSEGRLVFLKTKDGKKYVVQYTLEQLILKLLHPRQYFRVNRSYIISFNDIKELQPYQGGRFKVILYQPLEESIIVSRENVNEFKKWLGE